VQDELPSDLAKIADLKVITSTSVMQYKNTATRNLPEIAQALKVAQCSKASYITGQVRCVDGGIVM
jgi:TolB-like protein